MQTSSPSAELGIFCRGVEWICILFFSCTESLGNPLQMGKYLDHCDAETKIYSGQVYKNEWP